MNKKLLAVAVAGALGAPALAFAQASTVQIYGTISYGPEWRSATGGDGATAAQAAAATLGTPNLGASSIRIGGAAAGANVSGTTANLGGAYVAAGARPADINTRTATSGSGSNFGLRGREDLGGGFYAGFQVEFALQGDAVSAFGPATNGNFASYRNTGLWLGTSVGEFGTGMWDTPYATLMYNMGPHAVYGNSSTSSSAAIVGGFAGTQSTYSGQSLSQLCNGNIGATAASCFAAGTNFSRRQQNSWWWQSPNWNGFSARAVYGSNQPDSTAANATPNELKSDIWGVSGTYTNGPLFVGAAYEKHRDYSAFALRTIAGTGPTGVGTAALTGFKTILAGTDAAGNVLAGFNTAAMTGSDDYAWNISARYNFDMGLSIGAYWERLSYSWQYDGSTCVAGTTGGSCAYNITGVERDAWRVDGLYRTGNHNFALQYANAQDASGTTIGQGFNGNQTGVHSWIAAYAYSFSKRTSLFGYYTQVTNDTNARTTGIVFQGLTPAAGGDPKYYGVGMRHTF